MHGPVDGALNMALDRAVQVCREQGSVPPTLRLYSWSRPTVTLGRFQDPSGVDADACEQLGVDIVRRFTGGRGVLHDDELTYSVVAGLEDGVPRGVAASYRHLSAGLVGAYRQVGVDASLTTRERGRSSASACYLQTTRADLSLGAHKLSGSAQTWHGSTVLQHGSLTISRDVEREARVFRLDTTQTHHLDAATVSLSQVCDPPPGTARLCDAAIAGFERALGIRLVPGELSAQEGEWARNLLQETQWDRLPERSRQSLSLDRT